MNRKSYITDLLQKTNQIMTKPANIMTSY